jgi:hypothetical protein
MVGTILPVVYGARARGRAATAHWLHLAGSALAAAMFGSLLGWLGSSLSPTGVLGDPRIPYVAICAIAAIYVLRELRLLSIPGPELSRQVPAAWRFRFGPDMMSFLYGAGLGAGVLTHIWVSSFYIVVLWVFLVGDPWLGFATLGAFGIARAAPIVWLAIRLSDVEAAYRLSRDLETWTDAVHLVDGLVLAVSAGAFLALSVLFLRTG